MNWRDRLDARIDRCEGCDQWRWDKTCSQCDVAEVLPFRRADVERGAA